MRIAIDYRMISGGPNVVNRGTGRYTQQQLREVVRLDHDNEYMLVCHPDVDQSLILPEISSAGNVSILRLDLPGFQRQNAPNQPDRMLRHSAQFQDWLYKQRVDLYHATTPYQLDELVQTSFDVCPLVVTMYDLIPVVYPQHYWPYGTPFHTELGHALRFMAQADRLIAISESAKRDAHLYLGVPEQRIDIAYPIAEPIFRRLPAATVAATMRALRERLPIPELFVMALTHIHHSKNIETLLAAYARLPEHLRLELPLVIVFFLRDSDRALLQSMLQHYGIASQVILTGLISDAELVALYNAATLVVHPSRYEGFGLPVVEAMQCGAPIITTTASSLPEVGGDAAVLVDPDDIQGFADAIEALVADPARRTAMRERGLEHVRMFNPGQLGAQTLAAYRTTLTQRNTRLERERPSVAMWTSLPPLRCGIADYTIELLEHLSHTSDVEIFVDDGYLPLPELFDRYHIHHHIAFERRNGQRSFDTIIYQMGVSFMHDYMYEYMRKSPGIVVIHDVICAAALYYVYTHRNRLKAFRQAIIASEGRKALQEFDHIERMSGSERDQALHSFFAKYYLLQWVIDSSLAQIVHMPYAQAQLATQYPQANIYTIDMGVRDPWIGLAPLRLSLVRGLLGLQRHDFIVGIFGSVASIKRIDVCIQAFADLLADHPTSQLLIVGERFDTLYAQQLDLLVQTLGIHDHVHFVGHTSRADFDNYLLACDLVLNLRYPPKLQMSAVLIRSIAAGKPVIISDIPEWDEFPEDFCWRVRPDAQEAVQLATYLRTIAADPLLKQRMAQAARSYFERTGTLKHMAAQYAAIVDQIHSPAKIEAGIVSM